MKDETREKLSRLWSDSKNWKLGVFYYCPEDPRILVPKQLRWTGWMFNFARPGGWALLIFFILLFVVPFSGLCARGALQEEIVKFLIIMIGIVIILSFAISKIQDVLIK